MWVHNYNVLASKYTQTNTWVHNYTFLTSKYTRQICEYMIIMFPYFKVHSDKYVSTLLYFLSTKYTQTNTWVPNYTFLTSKYTRQICEYMIIMFSLQSTHRQICEYLHNYNVSFLQSTLRQICEYIIIMFPYFKVHSDKYVSA